MKTAFLFISTFFFLSYSVFGQITEPHNINKTGFSCASNEMMQLNAELFQNQKEIEEQYLSFKKIKTEKSIVSFKTPLQR